MADLAGLRDSVLERQIMLRLRHDARLARLDVRVRVDGMVAHLRGQVPDHPTLDLLRSVVGWVHGVRGVWDLVEVEGDGPPQVIDLGVGDIKQMPDAVGIDIHPGAGVDVIADLCRPLPLRDDSVDHLFAVHVLEHLLDVVPLVNDIHRVVKPTGVVHVLVPDWRHPNAVTDPTHVRFFGIETFSQFCRNRGMIRPFRPLLVSASHDTVFADLQPLKGGEQVSDEEFARFWA